MEDTIDVLISGERINARIRELAKQINDDYAGKSVTLLTSLKGACFFSCELAKHLTVPVFMEYIQVASYEGTSSTGVITMKLDVQDSVINGKHVLIIEDIIDTGRTLSIIKDLIQTHNPASLAVCSLLDKCEKHIVPINGDYIGFNIGNDFVVGYGLDLDQKYRNLPYIGIVR
ncbi:MAG TPA: hypoxanthine phosphoribosyltransferase [Methanocorpusculum sp.]|nr:hypoxanthine phosphoribosyltransferase [Methanocorpusculum sp.]